MNRPADCRRSRTEQTALSGSISLPCPAAQELSALSSSALARLPTKVSGITLLAKRRVLWMIHNVSAFPSHPVKRKLVKTAILLIALLTSVVTIFSYRAFHASGAWIAFSPANQRWAVDVVASGFTDIGQDFRVHDLASSPFQPRYVCDLFWERRHWPNELHWSHDGSVAAILIGFHGHQGRFYGCAYDFLQHQPLRTGSFGSPLEPSADFTSSIDRLLASRGGVGSVVPVPDVKSQ